MSSLTSGACGGSLARRTSTRAGWWPAGLLLYRALAELHRELLPLLKAAVERGVRVTVFVRDPSDKLQGSRRLTAALDAVREVAPHVVEMNVAHQKVVVIDDRTVLIGSLNPLSQRQSREVMITVRGQHWARKLLSELHAEEFTSPPSCGACRGQRMVLRRPRGEWYWYCANEACPDRGTGQYKAWRTRAIVMSSRR